MALPKKRENGMYERKVTLGRDANGRLIRKSVYASSRLALENKVFELMQQCAASGAVDNEMTFGTYAMSWYRTYKAVRSINTRAMYLNALEKHILPEIGDLYFDELPMKTVQRVINSNLAHPETCKKIKITLVQIFDQAVRDGLIKSHTMRELSLPPDNKREKRALTDSEKNFLVTHDWSDKQRAFLFLAYYTGARREEILALQYADLDFVLMTVRYNKTIVYDKGNAVLVKSTKAQASTRTVPIPTAAAGFLKQYTSSMKPTDILFPMGNGSYMSLSSYTKFWETIRAEFIHEDPSSLDLTAHLLRHTYATMLYYSGISVKKAAQLMGHANTNMIMKVYAHLDDEREDSAGKLNEMFGDF